MLGGEPHAGDRAKRKTSNVGFRDSERSQEGGYIVGELLRGVAAGRVVAFTGAAKVDGDTGVVLGIFCDLERVAGQ
jgi:hypothetical protein